MYYFIKRYYTFTLKGHACVARHKYSELILMQIRATLMQSNDVVHPCQPNENIGHMGSSWAGSAHVWMRTVKLASASLIARFMGPTWGPSGSDKTLVGPMLAPWTLLSGICISRISSCLAVWLLTCCMQSNFIFLWHKLQKMSMLKSVLCCKIILCWHEF